MTLFRCLGLETEHKAYRRKVVKLLAMPNKALHLTAFPLRSKAAGELGRYDLSW
jgi:hypothetical protein